MKSFGFRRLAAGALLGLFAGIAGAQSYGTADQVLTIDAASFLGFDAVGDFSASNGYLSALGPGSLLVYAPVVLPDGAEITQICLYARNEDPSDVVDLGLQEVKLVSAGQSAGVADVPGTLLVANFHFGYGTVCTDPISYVFHEEAGGEAVAHRFWAYIPHGAFALGGARITWHRQVSAAPAVATFDDVPTGHTFFPYIEALKSAGITGGCQASPPLYCPDRPITRAEMAVYMSLALGLHWPN